MEVGNSFNYSIGMQIPLNDKKAEKQDTKITGNKPYSVSKPLMAHNVLPLFKKVSPSFGIKNDLQSMLDEIPEIKEHKKFIEETKITPEKILAIEEPEEFDNLLNLAPGTIGELERSFRLQESGDSMMIKLLFCTSSIYLLKLLSRDNIRDFDEMENRFFQYTKKISNVVGFDKNFDMDEETAAKITSLSLNEYGLPDINKINYLKEEILPRMQQEGIKFNEFSFWDVKKLIEIEYPNPLIGRILINMQNEEKLSKEEKQELYIDVIKLCRKIAEKEFNKEDDNSQNYSELLNLITNRQKLELCEDLYNNGFNSKECSSIILYVQNISNNSYNYEAYDKIKQLKPLLDKYNFKFDFELGSVRDELNKLLKSEDLELDIDIIKFCRELYKKDYEKVNVVENPYKVLLDNIDSKEKMMNYRELHECGYNITDIDNILSSFNEFDNFDIIERAKKFSILVSPYLDNSKLSKGKLFNYFKSSYLINNEKNNEEIIKKVNNLNKIMEYFLLNNDKLSQNDVDITAEIINDLIEEYMDSILEIIDITSETEMKEAVNLKYEGLVTLLESTKSLKVMPKEQKELLKNRLKEVSHPAQKLEKLSVISALTGKIDNNSMQKIIENIKSPKMTEEQKDLANEIFVDKTKNYNEQIEEFIIRFNVPAEKQKTVREFLQNNNMQKEYEIPLSIEKQQKNIKKELENLSGRINSLLKNTRMTDTEKQNAVNVLLKQQKKLQEKLKDMAVNPNAYTKPMIRSKAMRKLSEQVEAHINVPNDNKIFNKLLNKELYKLYEIDVDEDFLSSGIKYDSKYFSKLFKSTKDDNFKFYFQQLIKLIKENPNKKLSQVLDTVPENAKTHELFDKEGLNYNRWITFDENSKYSFEVKVNVESSMKSVKENLIREFDSETAEKLDKKEIEALVQIVTDMNIEQAGQKDLVKIIKAMEEHIKGSEYWQNNNNTDIKTFKDHIKIHKKNIQSIEQLKNTTEKLSVRLWNKDDVGRNLFFGNHVGCCTSIGNSNAFAAPQHLINSFVNGIEIIDKGGNSMGNSMCYFAKVDGKLTFVIDSFEANGKLAASKDLTEAIVKYSKQVCKEMGREDAKIMFGPNYNKINLSKFKRTENHTIEVIGRVPEKDDKFKTFSPRYATYIDATGGHCNINTPVENRTMCEMIDN